MTAIVVPFKRKRPTTRESTTTAQFQDKQLAAYARRLLAYERQGDQLTKQELILQGAQLRRELLTLAEQLGI